MKATSCLLTACLVSLAACDSSTAPADALSDADAEFLALEVDAMVLGLFDDYFSTSENGPSGVEAMAAEPRTTTYSYERSRSCPSGGTTSVAGSGTRVVDREAGTVDVENSGTSTKSACARTRGDRTLTIDGGGTFTHARHWLDREPTGTWSTSSAGEFTWTKGSGETGSCAYEMNSTIDTAANTRSVTGSVCGREIDRSGSWRSAG